MKKKSKAAPDFVVKCKASKDAWNFIVAECKVVPPKDLRKLISFPSSTTEVVDALSGSKVRIELANIPVFYKPHYIDKELPLKVLLTFPERQEHFANIMDLTGTIEKNSRSLLVFDNFEQRESMQRLQNNLAVGGASAHKDVPPR